MITGRKEGIPLPAYVPVAGGGVREFRQSAGAGNF